MEKDFDIFAISETWLNPGEYDAFVIGSLIPNGYRFLHSAREGRGGGVGLLFKSSLKVKQTSTDILDTITSFEAMEVKVEVNCQIVFILIVYRPPPSSANNFSTSLFMNEFSSLLESYIIKTGSLLIVGYLTFMLMIHLMPLLQISWACWNPSICDSMFIAIPTELDTPWT